MSTHLVIDTETTGLLNYEAGNNDPSQPHLCSLACILLDDKFNEVSSFYSLIKLPSDVEIPAAATAKHGITKEDCEKYGINRIDALNVFCSLVGCADYIAGHNINFDRRVLQIALGRSNIRLVPKEQAIFRCTMMDTTSICKLEKPSGRGGYKWPKLEEAYEFIFKQKHEDAHNALADCKAAARIYKWLHYDMFGMGQPVATAAEIMATMKTCEPAQIPGAAPAKEFNTDYLIPRDGEMIRVNILPQETSGPSPL